MNASQTQPTGTIEHIDPNNLLIEQNIRTDATTEDLDAGFVESIRQNGVIQPVVGWRDDEGVHVRYGQRRTLGARAAGVATIPVYVVDVDQADTAKRLVDQLIENEQRQELNDADRAEAWKALTLEGLSVAAIAKRTGAKRAQIKTGVAVANSDIGTQLVAEAGLTLDQAATLLEFEDDPQTVADLTEIVTSDPGYFPIAVQRARDERAAAAARDKAEQEEAAKGHGILSEHPGHYNEPYALFRVRTESGEEVSPEAIQGKEGVWVYVTGYRDGTARLSYFLTDPAALGYITPEAAPTGHSGPMTDEQKAARKVLIANNREWDAAETVRREWLTAFLGRKTLPKNAPQILAALLGGDNARNIAQGINDGSRVAKEILGVPDDYGPHIATYAAEHPTRALHAALAVALGTIESTTSRNTWRYPEARGAEYLRTLAAWGYTLSPVEKIAAMIEDDTTPTK